VLKTVIPTNIAGKRYLLESFIDITDRKQAEERLVESEEKFHLIFKNSNDAIYLFEITATGMPGRIVDANEMALTQTGHPKADILKKTFLEVHSHELPQKSRAIMMELLTRGQVRFEADVARKDGTRLPVEVSAQFARLNHKTYVIAISRDISRRKREERALRIANQKLQLMNIVAWHDIQNKVTGLRGYIELSKDLVTDEQMKKFIQSEEDVLKVIHQQIQYTKEYQEMGVHPQEWINLDHTLRMIISLAEVGGIRTEIDVADMEIFCDPAIAKVFSHLIDNTKAHGQKATGIRIGYRETPEGLVLLYEDNGIGIPEEQKKELFLRNVGTTSGFSLFFIHDLLEVSEMTIKETGIFGEGVRFEIGIPRGIYRFGGKRGQT
jgi:PAS domain S-box-containing protein